MKKKSKVVRKKAARKPSKAIQALDKRVKQVVESYAAARERQQEEVRQVIRAAMKTREKEIAATQARCYHRKGGVANSISVAEPLLRGTSPFFAVIKHKLPTGGIWVRCLRCGKEWFPYNPFTHAPATPGWDEAVEFPTDNFTSGSTQFIPSMKSRCHVQSN